MRIGIYARVSTIEQSKTGYSIGEQEKRLRKYCEARAWDVYHVYIDGGYSGANTERPAQIELVKARIQEITDQVSRYTELFSLRQLDIDELRASIDPLTDEREALRKELESLSMESRATTEHAYEVARSFGDVLERGDLDEIRFTLSELIDRIDVDGDVVEIHWKFA